MENKEDVFHLSVLDDLILNCKVEIDMPSKLREREAFESNRSSKAHCSPQVLWIT